MKHTQNNNDLEKYFSEAVNSHQLGDLKTACRIYAEIIDIIPDSSLVNYNYALALFELDDFDNSYLHYMKALSDAPDNVDVLYNLALCLKRMGRVDEAIDMYQKILSITPMDIDTLYNLGCAYKDIDEDWKAIELYTCVLDISHDHKSSLNNIAYLYHKNEEYESAEKFYSHLLKLDPHHVAAKHMMHSLRGETPQSAPPQYIEQIFDAYSSRFDSNLLGELEYSVPVIMREHFNRYFEVPPASKKGLDLGCGTGLGGEAFSDLCSSFDGIDISSNMIHFAQNKNIYSSLHVSEISEYLEICTRKYDLIIATDVFNYIGDLEVLFSRIYRIAHNTAHFCFSTELSKDDSFILRKSGRFAHSNNYIESICRSSGWSKVGSFSTKLRKDKEEWIEGVLYFLTKV